MHKLEKMVYGVGDNMYWICEFKKKCKARVHTKLKATGDDPVGVRSTHIQPPNVTKAEGY